MSTYRINLPSPDVINDPEAHQQPRVQAALTGIDPGDVLAVITSRVAAEADPQAHPLYTQPRSTPRHSTGVLLGHCTPSVPRLPAVSAILALLIVAQSALVSPASAQDCEESPYWGEHGELWDPNGPLKDYASVGYHEGADPIPYQQRPASLTFGPGRHEITDRIEVTTGVLRGAGMDQTTLYFPQGLSGMGYRGPYDNGTWDWKGGVITITGTEVGIEDLTIEFPPHDYRHHRGQGFSGIALWDCTHCWVTHVRVVNSDDGISIHYGHHNTVEAVEVHANPPRGHFHVAMSVTQDNLVQHFKVFGQTFHGLTGNWDTHGGVFANGYGEPIRIEPDHRGPQTTGLLYSNIQGTGGKKKKLSDTFLWNYMEQNLCPLDIYQAQLDQRGHLNRELRF